MVHPHPAAAVILFPINISLSGMYVAILYVCTCLDLSDRSIILKGVGQRLVRSANVSLRSDTPEDDDGAAPWADDTLLSSARMIPIQVNIVLSNHACE